MREKLIELMDDVRSPMMRGEVQIGEYRIPYRLAERIADHLIAIGVTIPVRCKDCKHCRTAGWGEKYCARKQSDGVYAELSNLRDDDFCSYGERRTE